MQIYTLGTSNRSWDEFVEILKSYHIELVVDVRRFPKSHWEWFSKEKMQALLLKEGIGYFYLGEELGGYRRGGYEGFMMTEEFKRGVLKLCEIAAEKKSAIICAERLPWRCHRRYISWALAEKGWDVIHIIEKDRIWRDKIKKQRSFYEME